MKQILLLTSYFTLVSCMCVAQKNNTVLSIGFYNPENLFNPENDTAKLDDDFTPTGLFNYTNKVYLQKLHNVATVLQKLATDVTPQGAAIIGLAEVENDKALTDLINQPEIKARRYKYVWFPTPDVRGISTAMLYNPTYFKLLSAVPFNVPLHTVGQVRPTRNVLYVKGILTGNDTVHIMVNHWPSRGGGQETDTYRQIAARVNKRIVDSLLAINANNKILIMGDLNDNPTDASVMKILEAKSTVNNTTLTSVFNPWVKLYNNGIGTEIYNGHWNLFDQILVSGAFLQNNNGGWKYSSNQIFRKDFLTYQTGDEQTLPQRSFTKDRVWDNGYSDHFPVIIYLKK